MQATVLVAPAVFEPEFCRTLIDYYERFGGAETGAMREIDGKTVEVLDYAHKRRRDQKSRATVPPRLHNAHSRPPGAGNRPRL